MPTEFVPEVIQIQILIARKQENVKVGETLTDKVIIWPVVEDCGRVVSFGERVEAAIREAVELAEKREAEG